MSERKRQMIVETAQCWYDALKNPTPNCSPLMGLSNALNHTENALAAILDGDDELRARLKQRLDALRAKT